MITLMIISLIGAALLGRDATSGPEQMDAIPLALPVWKEPKKVTLAPYSSSNPFPVLANLVRSIKAQYAIPAPEPGRKPACFTMVVFEHYTWLRSKGFDQPLALMMAHENCDPDVCPYCTRPKTKSVPVARISKEPVWARAVPIPEACSHGVKWTRCSRCWLDKNRKS